MGKKLHRKRRVVFKYILPPIAVILIVPMLQKSVIQDVPFDKDVIRCVIAVNSGNSALKYGAGYNYELLKLFSGQMGLEEEIAFGGRDYLDSLETGVVDLVVVPASDSLLMTKDLFCSIMLADSSAWVIRNGLEAEMRSINTWLAHYFTTEGHRKALERFSPSFEPFRRSASGRRYSILSPYDDLIAEYAAQIGWDRLMLTALVWKESQFHIEVRSPRGAVGLMQLMPRTAGHFEAGNLIDPEENISTAVKLIDRLQRMFRNDAADKEELMKFTLAAYNAGEGRLRDCISYAKSIGAPCSRWNDLVAIIPDMREDSILQSESVKLGKFQGYETINYISLMEDYYDAFCVIARGQSSPDPLATRTDKGAAAEAL